MLELDAPILVTGGSGFVGSHLLELLIARGYTNLHSTTQSLPVPGELSAWPVTFHEVELTKKADVAACIQKIQPSAIFHLASIAATERAFEDADQILTNNILLQHALLEAVRLHAPTARLVVISSGEVYAHQTHPISETDPILPTNPYGVSKLTQEYLTLAYAQTFGLHAVIARPFNHIGERQAPLFVVSAFAKQIAEIEKGIQSEMKVGNLTAIRDFSDVKDVVEAYVLLMEKGEAGQVYNIGSGTGIRIEEVLTQLRQLSKAPITVTTDHTKLRPSDTPSIIADTHKLEALGWRRRHPLAETLERVMMYWRHQV
jgi:GDP-4-dehydro-6-deoxy-D-mannose reductase